MSNRLDAAPVVALAGGVGAARFLRGLVQTLCHDQLTVIVNTGDDANFYGVWVSPDFDIVTYTLGGIVNLKQGYGIQGDTFKIVEGLAKAGHATWFRLGDQDFINCLDRSLEMQAGASLYNCAKKRCQQLNLPYSIIPMSNDPAATRITRSNGSEVHFEEYLVRDGAPDDIIGVNLTEAHAAKPAPGVIEALQNAATILLCPSNPVVSIAPILAMAGVREAIQQNPAPCVAISPIVAGAPVKGPADKLLRAIDFPVSVEGVVDFYGDLVDAWVIDQRDTSYLERLRKKRHAARPLQVVATETMMTDLDRSSALARVALQMAEQLR